MFKNGINLQMKIIVSKEGKERVAHDRYLLGKNRKFNVPSYTMVIKGRFSEIKETENEIPFDEYWNDKDSLYLDKDWTRIKEKLMHEYTCGDCGEIFKIRYKLPHSKTAYCHKCFPRHKRKKWKDTSSILFVLLKICFYTIMTYL